MILSEKLLQRILYGAALLGSGGGGKIDSGRKFINQIIESGAEVTLTKFPIPVELEKQKACIVCDIGSITAFDEKQDEALDSAYSTLVKHFAYQGKVAAVFPIETGPENTLAAFRLAAEKKLTVIDGDGAGRAVPMLPLCTFSIHALENRQPIAIANGRKDALLTFTASGESYDSILRSISSLPDFKNSASLAIWPNSVQSLAKACVPGTITRSLYCGQLLEAIRNKQQALLDEALPEVNCLQARLIGAGPVLSKSNAEEQGFNFSTTVIRNIATGDLITVGSQNESLIVYSSAQHAPVALAPDSICYLGFNFFPLTNAEIMAPEQESSTVQQIFIISVRAVHELRGNAIEEGFKKIIQNLGYYGLAPEPPTDWQPLGSLLLTLSKEFYKPLPNAE